MAHAPEIIERIRAQTDIVALVGRQVPLRRSGRNHMGRCPFHAERTPSFSVNAEKAMYYCFGCHQGGDVFAWVMQTQGLEFGDAVRYLAQLCGVDLPDASPERRALIAQQQRIARVLEALNPKLVAALWGPRGEAARRHLQHRAVPAQEARRWQLGFVDDGEAACRDLLRQGHSQQDIEASGITAEGREPLWLLLHQRLTFPIHDLTGRIIGYGGRILTQPKEGASGPKYLGSRDSALFHKRGHLFGLFQAQQAIRTRKQVVLVEGFMDVMASHRAGIGQAVAALGTALTTDHAQSCRRLAEEAVLMLDGDAAGERAASVAALTLLQAGLRVSVAWLPPGEDPASLVQRAGKGALVQVLEGARPAVEALMARAFAQAPETIEGRVQAAKGVMPLIDAMGESLARELYVGRLAALVGVPVESLMAHWERPKKKKAQQGAASGQAEGAGPPEQRSRRGAAHGRGPQGAPGARSGGAEAGGTASAGDGAAAPRPEGRPLGRAGAEAKARAEAEWSMVQELLLYAALRPQCEQLIEYVESPEVQSFLQALCERPELDKPALAALIEAHVGDPAWRRKLMLVQAVPPDDLDGGTERANRTLADILRRLKWRHVDVALKRVLGELRETERRGDATDGLLRRKQELTARKRTLSGVGR